MSHSHAHSHSHSAGRSFSLLRTAFVITATYMVIEAVGGLLTGSLALLADAGHMLSDAGALAIALGAARLATRPPDARQTMGYQRAEVLGAAVNASALLVLAIWITAEAFQRFGQSREILAAPMMGIAVIGLLVNLAIAAMLWRDAHSLNTRAALMHVLGDALGSVGAMIAGGLILWKGWAWADPLASVVIAAIIAVGAITVLREVAAVLMHATPPGTDPDALRAEILVVDGVRSVHDLHTWALRPGEQVVTVHVVLDRDADATLVCSGVRACVAQRLPQAHVTVQPEPIDAACH